MKDIIAYSVYVDYDMDAYYNDVGFDDKLCRVVGHEEDGSGAGMGTRDVCWYFKNKTLALNAFHRLRKSRYQRIRNTPRLPAIKSIILYNENTDEEEYQAPVEQWPKKF